VRYGGRELRTAWSFFFGGGVDGTVVGLRGVDLAVFIVMGELEEAGFGNYDQRERQRGLLDGDAAA
jgi:hypothetical protein